MAEVYVMQTKQKLDKELIIEKQYAWLPKRLSSKKLIWLKYYYEVGEYNLFVDGYWYWDVYFTTLYYKVAWRKCNET